MRTYLKVALCLLLTYSCSSSKTESEKFGESIKITETVDDLTSKISIVDVTPLETSTVLSNISKVLIDKSGNLYVLYQGGRILTLSKNGERGIEYSNTGRASNEYISPIDICLSKSYFSILDVNKILSFKIGDPSSFRSVGFPENATPYDAIAPSGDESFFLFSAFSNSHRKDEKGKGHLVTLIDDKSTVKQEFIPRNDCTFSLFNISQSRDNRYYLRPQDSEGLFYEFKEDEMSPCYRIDFGEMTMPARFFYEKAGEDIGMYMLSDYNKLPMEFHDTKKHVFCRYCGPGAQEYSLLYNKKTQECITWANQNTDSDFRVLCSDDDYFYMIPTADDEFHGPLGTMINKKMKEKGCLNDQCAIVKIGINF